MLILILINVRYSQKVVFRFEKGSNGQNQSSACSHCSCTIFVLISYSLDTQIMLIVILINVQYPQKAVFSFEKGSNGQNDSSSGSHHPVNLPPPSTTHPLITFGYMGVTV